MRLWYIVSLVENNKKNRIIPKDEDDGWDVTYSTAFKKGVKKYRGDTRVQESLKELLKFIMSQSAKPQISEYPAKFYVHQIKQGIRVAPEGNVLWAHLRGQQVGVVFSVDYDEKKLHLYGLGSHKDTGVTKT